MTPVGATPSRGDGYPALFWAAWAAFTVCLVVSFACDEEVVPEAEASSALPLPSTYIPETEDELRQRIDAAITRAGAQGRQVLLDFGANWCSDCREVLRVMHQSPARDLLESRYETVVIDVGQFDRHQSLRDRYDVERIATLVVLTGSGERLAQTTLEPISSGVSLTAENLAAWLHSPRDAWQPSKAAAPQVPGAPEEPVLPPEIVEEPINEAPAP